MDNNDNQCMNHRDRNRDDDSSYSSHSNSSDAEAFLFQEIIRSPIPGDTTSYNVSMDKPYFNIFNKYFSPVPGYYVFDLPNSISLFPDDIINIKIRLPRQMLKCKYGLQIPIGSMYFDNLVSGFKINAENRIDTEVLTVVNDNGSYIVVNNQFPAWIEFDLIYQIDTEYTNIHSITYSIGFDSFKLESVYGGCCKDRKCKCKYKCRRPDDVIKLEVDTVFQITTASQI